MFDIVEIVNLIIFFETNRKLFSDKLRAKTQADDLISPLIRVGLNQIERLSIARLRTIDRIRNAFLAVPMPQ
jgi:hypothetical protein